MTAELLNDSIEKRKSDVEANLEEIREKIKVSCEKTGRNPDDILLLAVTKTVPAELINHAFSLGIKEIGENRVQEFLSKKDGLNLEGKKVHIIGHLQTNKVKQIVGKVDMIESVDSVRLAKEINQQSEKLGIITPVLIEVNIGYDDNKSGVLPENLYDLLCEISKMTSISVKGLMTIPPISDSKEKTRQFFCNLNKLFIDITEKKIDNINMCYLSMGMSGDYDVAIEEGANIVRIGTALFGSRL